MRVWTDDGGDGGMLGWKDERRRARLNGWGDERFSNKFTETGNVFMNIKVRWCFNQPTLSINEQWLVLDSSDWYWTSPPGLYLVPGKFPHLCKPEASALWSECLTDPDGETENAAIFIKKKLSFISIYKIASVIQLFILILQTNPERE